MKKEKDTKLKKIFWKKELRLLPCYLGGSIWAFFTIFMMGWIVWFPLFTTKEIFTGELLSTGLRLKITPMLFLGIKH